MARVNIEDWEDENASGPPVNVDDVILKTEGTYEKSEEINDSLEALAELTGLALALEDISESVLIHGVKDKASMFYVHQNIKQNLSRLGLEHLYVKPSFEGYESLSDKEIVASLENIVGKIWDSITKMGSETWKKLTDFFKDFYEDIHAIAAKADALQQQFDSREDTSKVEKLDINQANYLHIGGKTDIKSIILGYENLCKVLQSSYPSYIDNVKKFYDAFFKAMQHIAGKTDWLESTATRGKLVDDFVKTVNKDLDKVLDTDRGKLEMSGGKIFDVRNIVIQGLPDLMNKNPNLDIHPKQTTEMPTKDQIIHMLSLISSNASVIDSYWSRSNAMLKVLSKAREDAADDSVNIDTSKFSKLVSRVDTHLTMVFAHGSLMRPLNVLAWHTIHVSRSLLKLNERAIENFKPKT